MKRSSLYRLHWLILSVIMMLTGCKIENRKFHLSDFQDPPETARIYTWWHWVDKAITREGITRDLESMKEQGIAVVTLLNVGLFGGQDFGVPQVSFDSPEWYDMFRFALEEADRLGLKLGIHNCDGWATSGGPWITPETSMKQYVWSDTRVEGGKPISLRLKQPEGKMDYYRDAAVFAYPVVPESLLSKADTDGAKANQSIAPTIDPGKVIDLTGLMSAEGQLDWDVPEGSWNLIRFGYTTTGKQNSPATDEGRGLEVDKMDPRALDVHFKGFPAKCIQAAGNLTGNTFKFILLDSWEAGVQNWTGDLPEEFERRRGYSMMPYMPVLCGAVVGSSDKTEAFLNDFRLTIADMIEEYYYRHFSELCRRNNLELHAEVIYDGGKSFPPLDILRANQYADVPMTEFWARNLMPDPQDRTRVEYAPRAGIVNATNPIYASAVYGKQVVAAEAYTGHAHYSETPWELKPFGDLAFTEGVNLMVLHSYVHQPFEKKPGFTLARWASHFNRHTPWWQHFSTFSEYLARQQYILQQGRAHADLCYFVGDRMPYFQKNPLYKLPYGYRADHVNPDLLVNELAMENGKLILPGRGEYRLLILPEDDVFSLESLQKLEKIVASGAIVTGPRPSRILSLKDFETELSAMKTLAGKLWGNIDGTTVLQNNYGKGKVIWGKSIETILAQENILPDIDHNDPDTGIVRYIHKKQGAQDIYYLFNQSLEEKSLEFLFHVQDKIPEIYDPQEGSVEKCVVYDRKDEQTRIPLSFRPRQSYFVVFSEGKPAEHITSVSMDGQSLFPAKAGGAVSGILPALSMNDQGNIEVKSVGGGRYDFITNMEHTHEVEVSPSESFVIRELSGSIIFNPDKAPGSETRTIEIDDLKSYTEYEDPFIRYFSGTAAYEIRFDLPAEWVQDDHVYVLHAGETGASAEVRLNGALLDVVWEPDYPLVLSAPPAKGANVLEIRTTNNWRNGLIGDLAGKRPGEELWTTSPLERYLDKDSKLFSAGVRGPIRIMKYSPAEISLSTKRSSHSNLTPAKISCQGMIDPQGLDVINSVLSWLTISSDPAKRRQVQTAYQILVADSESALSKNRGNLWNSGKVTSDQSLHIAYAGKPLRSHQSCFWKVRVWDGDGKVSGWSEPASWSMGFLAPDRWEPNWIGSGEVRTPLIRKEFSLPRQVKRAWVYASALGIYELRLNGQKVGDDLFAPGWTDYRTRVQYQRYDVTDLVKQGDNAIGAVLAPGWFAGNIAWFSNNRYGSRLALAAQLHLEFTDGATEVIASDRTWKASSGSLTDSDILEGDHYDARLEKTGWDRPGYDDSDWESVSINDTSRNLVAQVDPPVGIIREIAPVSVNEPSPGLFVYDLGQNFTGVVRIRVRGARGTTVTLQHAERLNSDGTLDRSNLTIGKQTAEATDTYILNGTGPETFQPQFTFHGFQYVSVQGLDKAPALSDVTGVVIGNRFTEVGSLHTSDGALNKLLSNIKWTAHNAWVSIPMDCPQRAERLGWAGDLNVMAATAPFFFDMWRSYAKWQTDLLDAQATNGGDREGLMSNVAPKFPSVGGGYGGGWGDVGLNLPYITWKRYGDTRIITQSYEGMQKWLSFLESNSSKYIVPGTWAKAADWQNVDDATDNSLIATAYFALCASQMAEMAAAIGRSADAAEFQNLFENIRTAFINRWVAADGTVANSSQTSYVLALQIGLLPVNLREAAAHKLVENIQSRDNHLSTGYIGTQWLLHVLTEHSYSDLAYTVLRQTSYPSWLHMAGLSTTIWESWGSLNPDGTFGRRRSLNHEALGSVGDWMYQAIGGLVPDDDNHAFKHFYIRPRPGGTLRQAEMKFQSPYGQIATRWTLKENRFTLYVEVPVNTTATILLPTDNPDGVTENGHPASASSGVAANGIIEGRASYKVGSGHYIFSAIVNSSAGMSE